MTETVVHQNPAVVAVAPSTHTPWNIDTQSVALETSSTSLVCFLVIFFSSSCDRLVGISIILDNFDANSFKNKNFCNYFYYRSYNN